MSFKIVVDSASGLTPTSLGEYSEFIKVCPMTIIVDDKSYQDTAEDLPYKSFYETLSSNAKVSTSQIPIGVIKKVFRDLLQKNDKVLFLCLSSFISGQYASIASLVQNDKEFKDRVIVYDTESVVGVITKMAFAAAEIIKNNGTLEEALRQINVIKQHNQILFQIEDVSFLEKSGRASAAVVAFCKALKLIPILELRDGSIRKNRQCRTSKKAIKYCLETIIKEFGNDEIWIYLGQLPQPTIDLVKQIANKLNIKQIHYSDVPRVLLSHIGPHVMGFVGIEKDY